MNSTRLLALALGGLALIRLAVVAGGYHLDAARYAFLREPGFNYWAQLQTEAQAFWQHKTVGITLLAAATLVEFVALIVITAIAAWWILSHSRRLNRSHLRERFLQATIDALPGQIAVINEYGVVVDVNAAWRDEAPLNGLPREVGANLLAGYEQLGGAGSEHARNIASELRAAINGSKTNLYIEYPAGNPDEQRWYALRASPFKLPGAHHVALSNEDITQRVLAEKTVRTAMEEAERANAAKSAFLANMSHELRTPLTAILGYAEMLAAPGQPTEDRIKSAGVIRRNGEHLVALINDILDLSKIEACRMTVDKTVVDLPNLISEVIALTRQRATQKNLDFELLFDGPVPRTIRTDALRLRQILVNLIGNAVKFTRRGAITITVSRNISYFNHQIRFDVADTGIGMNEQQLQQLFQTFSQADASTTRRFGGSGLGLAISQKLAKLLEGDISVTSEEGVGSTFSLTIDGGARHGVDLVESVQEAGIDLHATPQPQTTEVQLHGRILLAEDGLDNQELLATHLRDAGAEVTIVDNGKAALELGKLGRFDLIFMDMQMPEMDGYEATRQLRAAEAKTPIVALTANAMSEDRSRCIAAGCTDYLTKPIDRMRLLRTAAQYLPQSVTIGQPAPVNALELEPLAETQPQAQSGALPKMQIVNEPLRSVYIDDPKFTRLLSNFISRLPERVARLTELLEQEDWLQLRQAAHQMKGAGQSYGFAPLSEQAARAEAAIDAGQVSRVKEEVDTLIDLIRHVAGYEEKSADAKSEAA